MFEQVKEINEQIRNFENRRLISVVEELVNRFQTSLASVTKINRDSKVVLCSVQNTSGKIEGNLEITGEGCHNCEFWVKNDVYFSEKNGFFRGGRLFVGRNAYIPEIGSVNQMETVIELESSAKLKAEIVFPNVTLAKGDQTYHFYQEKKNVSAFWSEVRGLEVIAGK